MQGISSLNWLLQLGESLWLRLRLNGVLPSSAVSLHLLSNMQNKRVKCTDVQMWS